MSEFVRLEFADVVDLQTRLVLLPRVEEEGIGAVVAAYKDARPEKENEAPPREKLIVKDVPLPHTDGREVGTSRNDSHCAHMDNDMESVSLERKDSEALEEVPTSPETKDSVSKESIKSGDDDNEVPAAVASDTSSQDSAVSPHRTERDLIGLVLSGIDLMESDQVEWPEKEFTSILAAIREAPTPIVLLLSAPGDDTSRLSKDAAKESSEQQPDDDASTISSAHHEDPHRVSEDAMSPRTAGKTVSDRFANWGSQLRATSAILSAQAASGAAQLSTAVKTVTVERTKTTDSGEDCEVTPGGGAPPDVVRLVPCSMFVQCSSGKFVELPEKVPFTSASSTSSKQSTPSITTSSLLVVRESPSKACPTKGYSFQWYRSCENPSEGSVSSSAAGSGSHYSRDTSQGRESILSINVAEWTMLSGATHAAYQPNATDVGHYLRCEVTTYAAEVDPDGDHSMICETHEVVSADVSLFIGARQALGSGNGANFGNIQGRGNAEGRTFRLSVEISRVVHPDRKVMEIASSLAIYQVSGNTAERVHEQSIVRPTAIADPSQPKAFDLLFPCDTTSMLSVLCTDGRFKLQAPNRITRETFLLSLGIANYRGQPANLDVRTVLFPGVQLDGIGEIVAKTVVDSTPIRSNRASDDEHYFTPVDGLTIPVDPSETDSLSNERDGSLELELQALRSKLARKDKVISDLQREVSHSEKQRKKSETALSACRQDLDKFLCECRESKSSLRLAEKRIETHDEKVKRLKGDHARHVASLDGTITSQAERITVLEKNVRSLKNEKAVLSAAVEARESKIAKIADMQKVFDSLSAKVSQGDLLRTELNDMSQRYATISREMEKVSRYERECRDELEQTRASVEELTDRIAKEQTKTAGCQSQLENVQRKIQQLKAERNSFKQRAQSLSKEVSRICRNGRTVKDVEQIIADEEARKIEVSLLKSQKKEALKDLHHYRTAYEQSQIAQQRAGVDGEAMRALEQKGEMERVVAEMTEYMQAKEMQLETLMQVNQALTEELHQLAQASMNKNEI